MKEKEIMIKKTVFVAYDGTEFDDLFDCRLYEKRAFDSARDTLSKICVTTYGGDVLNLLSGSAWGGDLDVFYLVKVDDLNKLTCLDELALTTHCGNFGEDNTVILRDRIAKAWHENATVLVSVYAETDFTWYGTLEDVKNILAHDAEEMFLVR